MREDYLLKLVGRKFKAVCAEGICGYDITARIEIEALSNDALVTFGKNYAHGLEYAIDDLGMLALHTRIEDILVVDGDVARLWEFLN